MGEYDFNYKYWKSMDDEEKFSSIDSDELDDGKKYLDKFCEDIDSFLELVPRNLELSQAPELGLWEAKFHWYFNGRMLEVLLESGGKYIVASREPDDFGGEFLFGDPFDGFYENRVKIDDKERIKELFTWLIDE